MSKSNEKIKTIKFSYSIKKKWKQILIYLKWKHEIVIGKNQIRKKTTISLFLTEEGEINTSVQSIWLLQPLQDIS